MGLIDLIKLFIAHFLSNVLSTNTATSKFYSEKILSYDLNLEQLDQEVSMLTTVLCYPLPQVWRMLLDQPVSQKSLGVIDDLTGRFQFEACRMMWLKKPGI